MICYVICICYGFLCASLLYRHRKDRNHFSQLSVIPVWHGVYNSLCINTCMRLIGIIFARFTQTAVYYLPGISVPFENYTVCVMTSTGSKQCDYIITQNACFQTELKSPVWCNQQITFPFKSFVMHARMCTQD